MNAAPLRVLVADDESLARTRMTRLVQAIEGVRLVASCEDAEQVLTHVRAGGVDVVLLDIQMPGLTGLDAVAMMPEPRPYVIFCTAHPEHALQAFDAGAVDYVLKPVDAARLQRALDRARARHIVPRLSDEKPRPAASESVQRLAVQTRHGIVLLDPTQVTHATLEGELVTLYTREEAYLTDLTLHDLQQKLAPAGFERVHRRSLLHLGRVVRLVPLETGGFLAYVEGGRSVEVSRQAARELRRRLGLRKGPSEEDAG